MALSLRNVTKTFSDKGDSITVLSGINLELAAGETVALTGDSGSGKSTILHIAGGLESPSSGDVFVVNQNLCQLNDAGRAMIRRNNVSIIFQQFNLIPSITVEANIRFHAELSGRINEENTLELIEGLGLGDHTHKYPEALSGGQQQRVAIARALAMRPALLLADEPTGNLDERTADNVISQMLELVSNSHTALLMVTHSPTIAAYMQKTRRLHIGQLK